VVLDIQLAAAYVFRFELDSANTYARRAVTRSRRLRLGRTHAVALGFQGEVAALRGDRRAVDEATAEALRAAPDDAEIEGFSWSATGAFELLWGEREAAMAALDRASAAMHRVANSAPGHYRGLWALLHAVGQRPDAAECVARVRESGATVHRANRGYLHYAEAVLARSAGAVATGDRELGHVPVWRHLGRMLVAEAAAADGWGAPEQWLREARACFESHRLDHLVRRCGGLLGEAPRWEAAGITGITAREAEVLRLVAAGLANKQIAARLHLSVRTVEKHVENLLRKAGARSRAQLVAMVGGTT
jgi:DNA-binding CsgD family transcriptional regulator